MIIFNEDNQPVLIDSISERLHSRFFWCFDANDRDFLLQKLTVLEEITAPTFMLNIGGTAIHVPSNWNVLIFDPDTMQVDSVDLGYAAGKNFTAFVYGPNVHHHDGEIITVVNYFPAMKNVAPLMNKHQMLCHPISNNKWICVSPHHVHKYLKHTFVGNLLNFD